MGNSLYSKAKRHFIKAAFTHAPCLTMAIVGGVAFPHLIPKVLMHNMALEIPLTVVGVILGEVVGHKLFNKDKKLSSHFSSFAKPANALKLAAYSVASIALHLAVFSGAHLHGGEIHLHNHDKLPNFAPHLPQLDH